MTSKDDTALAAIDGRAIPYRGYTITLNEDFTFAVSGPDWPPHDGPYHALKGAKENIDALLARLQKQAKAEADAPAGKEANKNG